jgi:hypothetical protein
MRMTPPPRPQPVTDGDVIADRLTELLDAINAEVVHPATRLRLKKLMMRVIEAVHAEHSAHAQAVAQAREEGEREGIRKAAVKAANCKIEGDSWPYRSGQGFARKSIVKAIRAIPTPSQEDRT